MEYSTNAHLLIGILVAKPLKADCGGHRGQPIPNTIEAWKYHAHLMADLAESQRTEIGQLKAKLNKLKQKLEKHNGQENS